MTTPLFLSESIPLELRNILKSLEIGMPIKWNNDVGTISFISDHYITICVRKIPDETYRNGEREVNVVCPRNEWDNLEIEDSHFKNVKNYKGKTNDHPGNESLPPVKKR